MDLLDESEIEDVEAEQDRAHLLKSVLSGVGGVMQNQANVPSAYEYMYGKKMPRTDFQGTMDRAASSVWDPMERKKKAFEFLKQRREAAMAKAGDDPSSPESVAIQEQVGGMFPQFSKFVQGKSKAQIMEMMPILSQKARGDEDRALREQEMRMRNQDRDEARADKRAEKELKAKELSSTQAKQAGLLNMGLEAEGQFNKADKKDYDPTSYMEFIDNSSWAPNLLKSDAAIESRNAQGSWIESFLRDASGASIPEHERDTYRKIYFPQPGDSEQSVKNKASLRAQKMKAAGAGSGVEGHDLDARVSAAQRVPVKTQTNSKTGEKRIVYNDGSVEIVPGRVAGK